MAQHFLLTSAARTLSLASVMRMSDEEVEQTFIKLRWSGNDGKASCPHCGCPTVYPCRRPNGAPRWRCKACRKDFSVTSGTLFAFHKLPLKAYLLAIAIFCNEVKGKSMLAMSRDLGVQVRDELCFGSQDAGSDGSLGPHSGCWRCRSLAGSRNRLALRRPCIWRQTRRSS